MVEGGHTIDPAGRQLELGGDEQQQIILEVAEQLLRLVQHLDEGVLAELVLLHVDLQDFEALVAGGMFESGGEPAGLLG